MLKDIIRNFKEACNNNPFIVMDNYTMKEGLYIKFNIKNGIDKYEHMIIAKNVDTLKDDKYKWFRDRDYYSSILDDDMNKAVDTKKQIHSVNEFSVFIKKNNFPGLDKNSMDIATYTERIDGYFDALEGLEKKYWEIYSKSSIKKQEKLSKEQFFNKYFKDEIEYLNSQTRIERLGKIKKFFNENVTQLKEIFIDINSKYNFANYIKIFIDEDIEIYKKAYELYLIPRIFNKNDFNAIIDGKIVGLPGSNITANDKKPYLMLKSMKTNVPMRITSDDAIAQKDLFLWLKAQDSSSIQLGYDYEYDTGLGKNIEGSYFDLYLNKGELNIEDYDNLPFKPDRMEFIIKNYLNLADKESSKILPPEGPLNRGQLLEKINTMFFAGRIKGYFKNQEPRVETNVFTANMQSLFFISRDALYDFIVHGVEKPFKSIVNRITMESIKEQLLYTVKGIPRKIAEAYNFRLSLLEYFDEGGKKMGDCIRNVMDKLREKLNLKELVCCSSDEEFYFTAGQVTYFILAQSEAKNKTYGMIEPFIHAKTSQDLKNKLKEIFNTYKHAIRLDNLRFKNAYSMVMGYECESKFQGKMQDMYYAGLMANNIMFEKKEYSNRNYDNREVKKDE